jgi:addiction module HigA family antidote
MSTTAMAPVHPGEVLAEEYLAPLGVTQHKLAVAIGVPPRRINEIVHGTRRITADTALRLARYFGTSERFWRNLQGRYDLELERDRLAGELDRIRPLPAPSRPAGRSLSGNRGVDQREERAQQRTTLPTTRRGTPRPIGRISSRDDVTAAVRGEALRQPPPRPRRGLSAPGRPVTVGSRPGRSWLAHLAYAEVEQWRVLVMPRP